MNDTPRTDAVPHNVADLAMHARKLEREIRQLEVAIYNLKTDNNLLHKAIDQVIEDRDSYHEENAELRKALKLSLYGDEHWAIWLLEVRKDKERLDWVLSDAGKYWLSCREDIDEEMEDSQ